MFLMILGWCIGADAESGCAGNRRQVYHGDGVAVGFQFAR